MRASQEPAGLVLIKVVGVIPAGVPPLGEVKDKVTASVKHQKAAIEYQANLPPIDVDAVPLEELVDTVAGLCRKYAPVAASVPCPPGMRDRAP